MKKPLKKAWPTKAAMSQIYEQHLWGGKHTDFYSGEGSHRPELVEPYVKVVSTFLSNFETTPVICDLGCGDFNVGSQLVEFTQKYIAVDIVDDLIRHNQQHFKEEKLEFHQLDLAKDTLPEGDIALLRQVLQHLSNKEIKKVSKKLTSYTYVILTEHLPLGTFVPNIDIISGQGTRLKKQSGVDLLAPPFDMKVKSSTPLLSLFSSDAKSKILTSLYTMF
ncbi:class I SAM-dependent methyltransferase [Psychroflexus tropicus]|uniref:class I SAM-dependent methyltransferase n=1 Tax=Psychroflexus tropicus TaxID=197345 RepID=UPI000365C524|nr:class I SAM-dependent methyltransferase [Psychroflexus tropicus]